jgi:hypothetical protein
VERPGKRHVIEVSLISSFLSLFAFILPFYFLRLFAYSFPWSQRYDFGLLIGLDIVT